MLTRQAGAQRWGSAAGWGNYLQTGILPFNPNIDLNFATGIYFGVSGSPTSFLTTARATVGMAVDSGGNWTSFAANQPRITNLGLLVEEARTNLFLNSQAPATQTITVANGSVYTVSVYGNATLTLSGAATGTVTQGNPLTFTASTTSLTVTVSGAGGSFQNAQVELGAWATSPIVTAGASATRAIDDVRLTKVPTIGASYSFTVWGIPQSPPADAANQIAAGVSDGTQNNVACLYRQATTGFGNVFNNATGGTAANFSWLGQLNTFPLLAQNALVKGAETLTGASGLNAFTIGMLPAPASASWNGLVTRVALWPTTPLSGAQLQAITT